MPFNATFDATTIAPKQGGGAHPVGNKFPFKITNTEVVPTKDGKGGMFSVEFTSDAGSITNRYNLWNESEAARRISNEQLSALCHALGIFQVDFKNDGAALRGGMGLMDIGFQKGHEPSAEKPEGGYVELKRVYDKFGNEPGKAPQNQQQQPNQGQQQGNAWGQGQSQQQPNQQQQVNQNQQQSWGQNGQGFNQPNSSPSNPPVQSGGFNPNPAQNNAQSFNSGNPQGQQGGWQQQNGQPGAQPPWG